MPYVPEPAHRLAEAARELGRELHPSNGQRGLATFQSAVGVVDCMATVVHAFANMAPFVREYMYTEFKEGRVQPTGEYGDVDMGHQRSMALLAASTVPNALARSARVLTALHGAMCELESTRAPLGEARPVTERQDRIGAAASLVVAALCGQDGTWMQMIRDMPSNDPTVKLLRETLGKVVSALDATHGSPRG